MDRLQILDEAAREVEEAAEYLEERRAGYGGLFLQVYEKKLAQVARFWEADHCYVERRRDTIYAHSGCGGSATG